MIEDEILSLLSQAKGLYKTHEAAAEILGVPKSTFHSWVKTGKGIKDQVLFKALNILGAHITTSPIIESDPPQPQEEKDKNILCQASAKASGILRMEVLKAKNESLEDKVKMLTEYNESLQEQIKTLTAIILAGATNEKEADSFAISGRNAKIS